MIDEAFAAEVERIHWFASVGQHQQYSFSVPFEVASVSSWVEAFGACSEEAWEEAMLGPRNRLTKFLSGHHRERYRQWNVITAEAKDRIVTPLAERVWQPFAEAHRRGEGFVSKVMWDVLAAIMEHEYSDCSGRPFFFLHLLDVYRDGHFPSCWQGGWQTGRLLVY